MKAVLTERALRDLADIGRIVALDNPPRSITYINEIRLTCEQLGFMPKSSPVVLQFRGSEIRRKPFGNYLIFYRISDSVEILRVLHGARNYREIFKS